MNEFFEKLFKTFLYRFKKYKIISSFLKVNILLGVYPVYRQKDMIGRIMRRQVNRYLTICKEIDYTFQVIN